MPKKKLKDVHCYEIRCRDCPLRDSDITCNRWRSYETFEKFYLRYKDLLDENIDLEKEVEVHE